MIKTGYKVLRKENGQLVSALCKEKAKIVYPTRKEVRGKIFNYYGRKKVRFPILVFETLEMAKNFHYLIAGAHPERNYEIWKCKYKPGRRFKMGDIDLLEKGRYESDPGDDWPLGTDFAEKLILIKKARR